MGYFKELAKIGREYVDRLEEERKAYDAIKDIIKSIENIISSLSSEKSPEKEKDVEPK